jgi:hypothetical protein
MPTPGRHAHWLEATHQWLFTFEREHNILRYEHTGRCPKVLTSLRATSNAENGPLKDPQAFNFCSGRYSTLFLLVELLSVPRLLTWLSLRVVISPLGHHLR